MVRGESPPLRKWMIVTLVCCVCKRVRTSKHTWESRRVEDGEKAQLSHGLCDQCFHVVCPD